jgi:glucan phosphoethanolaminetransferase (alkaline phosphatase superfamily)
MPLKPQKVVIRWMVMPWVKSLLPFILLGLVLGFSLADASMIPDAGMSQAFAEYAGMGTRAVLMIVPLHLVVFTITWAVGIWFMNHQRHKKALFWVLSVFLIFLMVFISGITVMFGNKVPNIFQPFSNRLDGATFQSLWWLAGWRAPSRWWFCS